MAVTVVRGIASSSLAPEATTPQRDSSSRGGSLSQLVTRAVATDAAIIQVKSVAKASNTEKLRDFSEANAKAAELSERISDEKGAEDAHTGFEPASIHRALSSRS